MNFILLTLFIAGTFASSEKEIQSQIEDVAKHDFGKKIMKDLQYIYRQNKNQPLETIVTLNGIENDLVSTIEKDMKNYQNNQ